MKCAIGADKENRKRIIIMGFIGIFAVILCAGGICFKVKENKRRILEEELKAEHLKAERMTAEEMEIFEKEMERQYVEFEKLFHEQQDDLQRFVELFNECDLEEVEYLIIFDEESYISMQSANIDEWITILYTDDIFKADRNGKLVEFLNRNTDLIETLNTIKEKGVVEAIDISYLSGSQMISFMVDTEYTSFITTNCGITNYFAYCTDKECERYGYRNIEGNWYMYIPPEPE